MKRFLSIFIVLFCIMSAGVSRNQTISYTYKALKAEGCSVAYTMSKQGESYYILVCVSSDRMLFTNEPTIKIRTFKDEVVELKGEPLGNNSSNAGVLVGSIMVPVTEIITNAQFKVDESTMEKLNDGVKKIRIVLSPLNHEREFHSDKIGKKLYKNYKKLVSDGDDF